MSDIFKLNWKDLGKAFLLIVLTPVVASLGTAINNWLVGGDPLTWSMFLGWLKIGLAAGVSYLIKNFFTNSENKLGKTEPIK